MAEYNIYCDESCHLEHDRSPVFVLGGIYCEKEKAKMLNAGIINIKEIFGYNPRAEVKWTEISPGNVEMYLALVDYFFDNIDSFGFRGYVARGKDQLDHVAHHQTYDDWYYKMYYEMLKYVFDTHHKDLFNLYLDMKDTRGADKLKYLKECFNSHYRYEKVLNAQEVRSDHIAILQLNDIFIGALAYKFRELNSSAAKLQVIDRFEKRSGQNLLMPTPYRINSINWFIWVPDIWR